MNINYPVSQNREVGFSFLGYPEETLKMRWLQILASYIIGDLIAIPFSYVFSKIDFADITLSAERI